MHFTMFHKLGLAAIVVAWVIGGVNFIGNLLIPEPPMAKATVKAETSAQKPPQKTPVKPTETAAAPVAASAPPVAASTQSTGGVIAMLATADAGAGKKVFNKCRACHTTNKGGKNRVGPNLWNIVGLAKAGSQGYRYSGALKNLGGEWTYGDLDGFLAKPKSFAKGTKMSFGGIRKPGQRAALIVYLRSLSDQPKPLP